MYKRQVQRILVLELRDLRDLSVTEDLALKERALEDELLVLRLIYPYESQSSMVDIGCVLDTEPAAGTTVKAGDAATLTISRGINY